MAGFKNNMGIIKFKLFMTKQELFKKIKASKKKLEQNILRKSVELNK